ncbi:hypothetical protein K504DRAFT_466972 [Pleomassaria siparia CBS 279.74]|uniref:Mid2 domain-containing protein n=1 Tax=Pleomassaria siparia CBS 279.74 TaxID=1314801 RepID=A0A6G1KCE1_9PLEO|nr:hypothetical protein K504DRAFT_466972 [Pleomassaria siparia CBS 279.74]
MVPSVGPPKLSRISLLVLLLTTLISTALSQDISTFEVKTCGNISGLAQCGTGFPFEFCCPTGSTCTALNSTGVIAAICCPKGSDCSYIKPVTCDVNQFNATLHPDNQVHLSDTKGITLPKCGTQCCPLGYKCAPGGMCAAEAAAIPTPSSSSTSTSTSLPSATVPPSISQTQQSTAPPVVETAQQGFNGRSFAAGFFPGIVIGALGTLALIWMIKKRRESKDKDRFSGDFGHVARTISDPIYDPAYSTRSDFIRSNSRSTSSTANMVQKGRDQNTVHGMTPRLKSIWERTPKLGFGGFGSSANVNTNPNNYSLPSASNNNTPTQQTRTIGTTLLKTGSGPRPPPPAVRAGHHSDPYKTPDQTPAQPSSRSRSRPDSSSTPHTHTHTHTHGPKSKKSHSKRPITPSRDASSETIDVLMPAPGFLAVPKAPGMQERRGNHRLTSDTTFTKLMERAGFEQEQRGEVRNLSSRTGPTGGVGIGFSNGSPARAI